MEAVYITETIHDLAVHREFRLGYLWANRAQNILRILLLPLLLFYISQFEDPFYIVMYLAIAAVALIFWLKFNSKKGDLQYKRMLQASGGEPQHTVIQICQDSIVCIDRRNENKFEHRYELFVSLIKTPHLILLVQKHKLCLVLEKRWLRGGSSDELTAFLLAKCPNIRRKKPKGIQFGKWLDNILYAVLIIGALFAVFQFPGFSLLDKLTGKLHNDMSYQQMSEELAPLGITISGQTITELEAFDSEYADEYGDYYDSNFRASKVYDLLCWEGTGVYDEETWEWTPSTSGVYWFDTEVMAADSIYTDFLAGVSAMHEELNFTNIQEDYSNADIEAGTGTVRISFDWNGQRHELTAVYDYDWFDTSVLSEICRIAEKDSSANNLYVNIEHGQACLLYYGTPQQLQQLERKTGLDFMSYIYRF